MSDFHIHSLNHRDVRVLDARGAEIGSLHMEGFFQRKASASANGHTIRIASEGAWNRRYDITVDGRLVGTMKLGWARSVTMDLQLGSVRWPMRFGARGVWDHRYVLSTDQGIRLLDMRPKMRWFAAPDHDVDLAGSILPSEHQPLVLIVAAFAVRILRVRHASAV